MWTHNFSCGAHTGAVILILSWAWLKSCSSANHPPNIVLLLADDLGIGDLGCYGNESIRTPNIDRLSKEGIRLMHHLAAASLCTPSRAALLTARYPARYGLVGDASSPPVIVHVASRVHLPYSEVTLAEALSAANYSTAIVGKWHLGSGCELFGTNCQGPLNHGFHTFYGLPFSLFKSFRGPNDFWIFPISDYFYLQLMVCAVALGLTCSFLIIKRYFSSAAFVLFLGSTGLVIIWFLRTHYRMHTEKYWQVSPWMNQYLNGVLMRNTEVVQQPLVLDGLAQNLANFSLSFLEDSALQARPFFLFHSFAHVHTPMFSAPHIVGQSKYGSYGDNVEEMDEIVGVLLNALDRLGLSANTIVYFVSDHGGHLEVIDANGNRIGGHNGPFKGGKAMGGPEGGIRIPGIIRYPGVVSAGLEINRPTSLLDTMPTLLELAGLPPVHQLVPSVKELDGVSFAPLLKDPGLRPKSGRVFLHHCRGAIHAMRVEISDHTYKMYLAKHKWEEGSFQCGWGDISCPCYGEKILDISSSPEVYDLSQDPYEDEPLSKDSKEYKVVIELLQAYLKEWQQRVTYPPSLLSENADVLLLPWLQPFCLSC